SYAEGELRGVERRLSPTTRGGGEYQTAAAAGAPRSPELTDMSKQSEARPQSRFLQQTGQYPMDPGRISESNTCLVGGFQQDPTLHRRIGKLARRPVMSSARPKRRVQHPAPRAHPAVESLEFRVLLSHEALSLGGLARSAMVRSAAKNPPRDKRPGLDLAPRA